MKEDAVQRAVRILYESYGGEWYNLSQGYRPGGRRHGSTRQTPGLPDLWVFFVGDSLSGLHSGLKLWHETKRLDVDELRPWLPKLESPWVDLPKRRALQLALETPAIYARATTCLTPAKRIELYRKKQSAEQILFERRCHATKTNYVLGGVEEAHLWVSTAKLTMGKVTA